MIANCGTLMSLGRYGCVLWLVVMIATSTICTHVNILGLLGYKDDDRAVEMQESKG